MPLDETQPVHLSGTLSYAEVNQRISDARIEVFGTEKFNIRAGAFLLIALLGAGSTIASALWQPLHSIWHSVIGFSLELLGLAGFFWLSRHSGEDKKGGDLADMDRYDALHQGYDKIIQWVADFETDDIASHVDTLDLLKSNTDTANRWLLGPSDKLGALPAVLAVLFQIPTLSGSHGTIATIASSMLVAFTLGFCVITLRSALEQVRDKRLEWVFVRAAQMRQRRENICARTD